MQTQRRRQEPISCRLCRTKKLRCDRQQPCANCTTRGVRCETSRPPRARDDSTVLARLEHLEGAVESLRKGGLPLDSEPLQDQDVVSHGADKCLPPKHEAVGLFYHYNTHVNYLHHVIHAPSVLALLDRLYSRPLAQAEPAHTALLLGMLAGAAHFWNPTVGIFAATDDAQHASGIWLEAALEALHHARRTSAVCLEEVQASIIVSYLVYNVEGFSSRFRLLSTAALGLARDLSLHKIDGPLGTSPLESRIQTEVKRRVWWHVVSLDWLLAFTPGPQEGTYLVQPRHMAVNLPQDADDLHLEQGRQPPPSQPTTMAYFLQRVRLAEICRHIADAMTELPFDLRQTDSGTLRNLDRQFEHFLNGLPSFFRLDEASRHESRQVERHFPHLSTQRYLIHLGANTRRSKLHQPWLVRGFREPQLAFARNACLLSSRTVLQVARLLEEDGKNRPFAPAKLCTVVHHVAMAAVVLTVDLAFTKIRGPEEEHRKLEIVEACQILERARMESAVAERLLGSLNDVLQRHNIHLPQVTVPSVPPATVSDSALPILDASAPGGQGEAAFDTSLQNDVGMGFDLDIPAWDELFADLNACPITNTDLLNLSL